MPINPSDFWDSLFVISSLLMFYIIAKFTEFVLERKAN
jgi:hypothetical protein